MKLNDANLAKIALAKPSYDRHKIQAGIVHLGIGNFHRAHMAVYVDDLLNHQPQWGIIGASLRSTHCAQTLNPQNGLYTLITAAPEARLYRIIGSLIKVIAIGREPEALLEQMTDSNIRIVSLTITEKGYCHHPATGQLNNQHEDIIADLATPHKPRSAPGIIVEALRRRRASKCGPFTVLSCDNLPANGQLCGAIVIAFAHLKDPDLALWIQENVTFPNTMVDRIVPATQVQQSHQLQQATNIEDNWPVATEPFSQWVIEDNFCAGRPDFEKAGVQMVADVDLYEKAKLRLLNASHSALAYLGSLSGYDTVAQAMLDPRLATLVADMMATESAPTLGPKMGQQVGFDSHAYQAKLLKRFCNPSIQHQLLQIATDGSQKLPQRILDPIRERLNEGLPIPLLARCVAGWIAFISERRQGQFRFDLNDPQAPNLRAAIPNGSPTTGQLVESILAFENIFGEDLSHSDEFHHAVIEQYNELTSAPNPRLYLG